jgi:MarR family transcriptional regulator, temperature-dependent positive regulator of motility
VILLGLSQQPGLLARDICRATGLPKNSISRAVSDLLRKGLVTAETEAEDRRAKRLTLTRSGAILLAEALPAAEARQTAMRAALTEVEAEQFDKLLLKLIEAMPDWVETE